MEVYWKDFCWRVIIIYWDEKHLLLFLVKDLLLQQVFNSCYCQTWSPNLVLDFNIAEPAESLVWCEVWALQMFHSPVCQNNKTFLHPLNPQDRLLPPPLLSSLGESRSQVTSLHLQFSQRQQSPFITFKLYNLLFCLNHNWRFCQNWQLNVWKTSSKI